MLVTKQMIRDLIAFEGPAGIDLGALTAKVKGPSQNAVMGFVVTLIASGEVTYNENTGTYSSNLTLT